MKKYRVWTHFDTGIELDIEAKNEDEAIEKAENMIENNAFETQIYDNLQRGKTEVVSEIKEIEE